MGHPGQSSVRKKHPQDKSAGLRAGNRENPSLGFPLHSRGERYIGMWLDDLRHGEGVVVTQSGLCYQRTFHADKMVVSPRFPWNLEIPGMGKALPKVSFPNSSWIFVFYSFSFYWGWD